MIGHELEVDRAPARRLRTRGERIRVVGLGYVGLPLAVRFAQRGHGVVGVNVDDAHVETLSNGTDATGDLGDEIVADCDATSASDASTVGEAEYVGATVPTPLDEDRRPDLGPLVAAGRRRSGPRGDGGSAR